MKSITRVFALSIGCAALGACATVTRGTTAAWEVRTTPPGATVQASNGLGCRSTPCSLRVARRADFTATVSKPGFKNVDIDVSHGISTVGGVALAGNVILGGLVGVGVDVVTGAYNDPTPNGVDLKLEPDEFADAGWGASYGAHSREFTPPATAAPPQIVRSDVVGASTRYEGRVVELKVLPDGSARETRERSY